VVVRKGLIVFLVIGVSLTVALTFGVVPAVSSLYAAHHRFAGAVDPWIIDAGSLAANAALLVVLFRLRGRSGEAADGEDETA
jgi:hypothetical protein